jgi:hypothetical protein
MVKSSVARIRNLASGSGMEKIRIRDNILDHNSESLATYCRLKILKFFVTDPGGCEIPCHFDPGPGMEKFGPGKNNPDQQHWKKNDINLCANCFNLT